MSHGPWQIQLLGELRLARGGKAVETGLSNQTAELIAQLAERVGRQISRDQLIEELWPNADTEQARNRFRVLLSAVRHLLEPDSTPPGQVLFANRTVIGLSASACEVDVERFMRHAHLASRAATSEERMAHYRAVDELYRGEFLSDRTGDWILARRAHYARVQALAQYRYAALLEEAGDAAGALEQIHRSIEADPLREAPRRRALRMLAEAGDVGAALAQFEEFQSLLKRALGLAPTREFQDWIRSLKGGAQPRKPSAEPPGPASETAGQVSFDALGPADRELCRALSVFRGGFETGAAGSVCGAFPPDLARLAAAGLIAKVSGSDGSRYAMPEALREAGWADLDRDAKEQLRSRHATYFFRLLADNATLHMHSGIQQLSRLRRELENLRSAMEWTLERQDAETAARASFGLVGTWIYSGLQQEGRETIARVRSELSLTPIQEATLDAAEGVLAVFQDNPKDGAAFIRKAVPVMEEGGMQTQASGIRWLLGYCAYLSGNFEKSLAIATEIDPDVGAYQNRLRAYRNNLIGMSLCELDRLEEAEPVLKDVRRQWQELGDLPFVDYCRLNLARVTWKGGDLEGAWKEYRQIAAAFMDWDDQRGLAYAVEGLGRVSADQGRFKLAARFLGAAEGLRDSMGLRRDVADERAYERAVDKTCAALGNGYGTDWEAGYALAPDRIGELF